MNNTVLQTGESIIDTWTLFYTPPEGKKFNGKLTVTNRRLIYRTSYNADYNPGSYHVARHKEEKDNIYVIMKTDIVRVDVQKSLLAKKAILTLSDGTKHEFNYGIMSVDKLVAAINSHS